MLLGITTPMNALSSRIRCSPSAERNARNIASRPLGKSSPPTRPYDRLHINDRTHGVRVSVRTIEPEGRTPIVKDERDVPTEIELCKPLVEIPRVIREAIAILRRLAGSSHSHKVRRQASPERHCVRDDVPPQI